MKSPKPPLLNSPKPKRKTYPKNRVLQLVRCFIFGHVVNEGVFIDRHDNWDGLSYCECCNKLDV